MPACEIQRMGPEDWERVRAVRLQALGESPEAFGTLLRQDLARPPVSWQERLKLDTAATFLAARAGVDVGMATGAPYDDTAGLFGMWVDPGARGAGVGRALIEAVVGWARAAGHTRIRLDVGDYNAGAIRLYEACGFEPTGVTSRMPTPREHVTEHQRALSIAAAPSERE